MTPLLLSVNPFTTLGNQIFDFIIGLGDTDGSKLLHFDADFLNNNNSEISGWVFLLSYVHFYSVSPILG